MSATLKRPNRRTKLIHKTFAAMKQRGPEAWEQFLFLLNHPEPYVRYFAATYALRANPGLAIPVLERLDREERGILGFRASQALKTMEIGRLASALTNANYLHQAHHGRFGVSVRRCCRRARRIHGSLATQTSQRQVRPNDQTWGCLLLASPPRRSAS